MEHEAFLYGRHWPHAPFAKNGVIVLCSSDFPINIDDVIEEARDYETTTRNADGKEIFWIVFAKDHPRVWDFTEDSLRRSLKRMNEEA